MITEKPARLCRSSDCGLSHSAAACVQGMNRFQPFICIDPQEDKQPGTRDAEELIEVQRYTVTELKQLLVGGNMLLPSVATCYMALDTLREQKLL